MYKKFYYPPIRLICFGSLILIAACYQRFDTIEVKADNGTIIFSHPKITEAIERGNIVVPHSLHIYKKAPEGDNREMWYIANRGDGAEIFSAALSKSYVAYAENLTGMSVLIDPKPLRAGHYEVFGEIGIYNQEKEHLTGLKFLKEFDVTISDDGTLSVK